MLVCEIDLLKKNIKKIKTMWLFFYWKIKLNILNRINLLSWLIAENLEKLCFNLQENLDNAFVNKGVPRYNGNFWISRKIYTIWRQAGILDFIFTNFNSLSWFRTNKNSLFCISYSGRLMLLVLTNNFLWNYWWCLDCSFLRLLQFSDLS